MRVYIRLRRKEKLVKEENVYEKANETYICNSTGYPFFGGRLYDSCFLLTGIFCQSVYGSREAAGKSLVICSWLSADERWCISGI